MSSNENPNLIANLTPRSGNRLLRVSRGLGKLAQNEKGRDFNLAELQRAVKMAGEMEATLLNKTKENKIFHHKDYENFERIDQVKLKMSNFKKMHFFPPHYILANGESNVDIEIIDLTKLEGRDDDASVFDKGWDNDMPNHLQGLFFQTGVIDEIVRVDDSLTVFTMNGEWHKLSNDGQNYCKADPSEPKLLLPLRDQLILTNGEHGYQVVDFSSDDYKVVADSAGQNGGFGLGRINCGVKMSNGWVALGGKSGELFVVDPLDKNNPGRGGALVTKDKKYAIIGIVEYSPKKLAVMIQNKEDKSDSKIKIIDIGSDDASFKQLSHGEVAMNVIALRDGYLAYSVGNVLAIDKVGEKFLKAVLVNPGPIESILRLPDGRIVTAQSNGSLSFYGEPGY